MRDVKFICQERMESLGLMGHRRYVDELESELLDIQVWWTNKGRDVANELLDAVDKSEGPVDSNVSGSLILFLLGLSSIDPIKHGMKKAKAILQHGDPPDIDTDFDPRARDWVKDHIVEVFGEDNVCSIGTYSTYKTRAVILNVARALALDVMEANEVTKKLEPLRSFETGDGEEEIVDKMDFDDVCVHYPDLAAYLEKNPEVRYHSEIIRNQISNMGKHAAGVIISDSSLKGRIPVLTDASGGILSAWAESGSVQELSEVGLVKYDILGLNNLPIISDCIAFIEKHQGIKLRREDIPINDHTAIRQEARCDLLGIFQFENPATLPIVREVEMESLNDVAAITSLIRPGPKDMGMDMEYARRKHGQPYEVLDCIKHILAPTYGIIVYQEQMMQISQVLCGFDGKKANLLRKACGKKKVDLMKSIKIDFVKGAQPRIDAGEVTLEQVENMWELIVKFAGYGFNLSHAITYSAITTVEIWLKHNYPTEYMAALCNNTKQGKKRHGSDNILVEYINYSRRRGMEILPPDVSESGVDFRIQGTAIRFSIGHVKNVATAAEAIETMQPFTSIEDFHNRVKATVTTKTGKVREQKLNKKVFESLLYAGAFDKFGTRNEVAAEYSRLRKKKGEEPIELTDDEWLDKEREVIGLVLSVEPMVKKYAALVKAMGAQTIGEEATRKKVRLFGRIASMTPHTSRNGNSMFKVYFEDGIDSIMFFVFEGGKQRFRDEFKIGDVGLMPLGRFDDGGQRFFDDNGPCKVFTKEELEDAEAGRLPQDENQDAG